MNCNCIKHSNARRRCRGTAEVELMLLMPVLLTILLLCVLSSRLGRSRISTVREGEQQAYRQVVRGEEVNSSMTLQPVPGVVSVVGELPTRFDETSLPETTVKMSAAWAKFGDVSLHSKGAFLDPTWHFAGWPNSPVTDGSGLKAWFETYAEDGRGQDASLIQYGLGLADPWRP